MAVKPVDVAVQVSKVLICECGKRFVPCNTYTDPSCTCLKTGGSSRKKKCCNGMPHMKEPDVRSSAISDK